MLTQNFVKSVMPMLSVIAHLLEYIQRSRSPLAFQLTSLLSVRGMLEPIKACLDVLCSPVVRSAAQQMITEKPSECYNRTQEELFAGFEDIGVTKKTLEEDDKSDELLKHFRNKFGITVKSWDELPLLDYLRYQVMDMVDLIDEALADAMTKEAVELLRELGMNDPERSY